MGQMGPIGVVGIMKTILATVMVGCAVAWAGEAGVRLIQEEKVIKVELDGKPFTTYWFADGNGAPFVRPFFFPVLAPDGTEVTSDQSQTKGDHPHHRSLWVSHGEINGADHWSLKDGANSPKQRHVRFSRVGGDTIEEQLVWEGKDGQPMLSENRTWRFFVFADGARGIDLTSVYQPLVDKATFGDTKESGLIAVRVVKAISDTATLTQSTGATDARPSKNEPNTWGKKAAWCDISGKIGDKSYGITILDHPGNPRHPSNWHCRLYGLMSANIFGQSAFTKGAPKGDFIMEKDKPVTFRYRLVIHLGDAKSAGLEGKFKEFSGK